jgi:RNA polymerase sigma factor (sigma-70 family)
MSTPPPVSPERLEELLVQLRPRLRQVLAYFRIPYPDSEDLVQDVLVVALCKWSTIHSQDAWMIGTLRKKCIMYWKRRRNDRLQGADLATLESLSEPLEPLQERAERLWDLDAIAGALCGRHRAVLWLRFGLGLSTVEVAARTGYHHSSIRKLTCRTIARLRRELAITGAPDLDQNLHNEEAERE